MYLKRQRAVWNKLKVIFETPVPSLDKRSLQVTQRYLISFLSAKGLFFNEKLVFKCPVRKVPCMTNFQNISSLFRDNQSHGEFPYQLPLSPASNVITVPVFMFSYVVVSSRVPSVAHLGCLSWVSRTAGCQQRKPRFSSIELPSRSHFTVVWSMNWFDRRRCQLTRCRFYLWLTPFILESHILISLGYTFLPEKCSSFFCLKTMLKLCVFSIF